MRIVIVGGGKVGAYLATELRKARHSVIVIERRPDHAVEVAERADALVVEGDGTDVALLSDLELRPTDLFLAVTGVDEDNLVACQLARTAFGVQKVLARLNDPSNRRTFQALDIPVVSVTDLIVQVISRELDLSELVRVALLGRGEVSLFEVEIPLDLAARSITEIALPESSVIVAIRRDGQVIVPGGRNEIRPADRVLMLSLIELEDEVRDVLLAALEADEVEAPDGASSTLTIEREDDA